MQPFTSNYGTQNKKFETKLYLKPRSVVKETQIHQAFKLHIGHSIKAKEMLIFTSPQVSLLIRGHFGRDSIGVIGNKRRREGFTSAGRVSREGYSCNVNLRKTEGLKKIVVDSLRGSR